MKKFFREKNGILWLIVAAGLIVPELLPNRYYQDIAVLTLLWAGLAASWNIYSGYCGRLSIGHAAFMGIGAYTSTILYANYGLSPWLGMLAGGAIAAVAALIIGGTTLRLKGTFFVLSTIAFAEVLKTIAVTAKGLTGGSIGLQIAYNPGICNLIFRGKMPYAVIMWLYLLAALLICVRLERSRMGFGLIALGENQEAAENLGVDTTGVMLRAYVLSAVMTAFGGTLYAQYIMYIEPLNLMGLNYSVNFILYAIAGGMGTAFGPVVGAFILVPVTNLLRGTLTSVSGLYGLILGLILIGVLLWRPSGLLPSIREILAERRMKREAAALNVRQNEDRRKEEEA